jgi:cell division transport system ATP-binding protein
VNKPSLILADEPTGNLDPTLSAEIMRLFEQFNDVGVSVLIASHDLPLIDRLNHRVIALNGGRLLNERPAGGLI